MSKELEKDTVLFLTPDMVVKEMHGTFINENEDFLEIENFNFVEKLWIVKKENGKWNLLKLDGNFISQNEDFLDANAIFKKDIKTNEKMFWVQRKNKKYNCLKVDGTFKYKRDTYFKALL